MFAARQGYTDTVKALLDGGADINQVSAGDKTSPLLMSIINGHFDLAMLLLERGANPDAAAFNGAAPLFAVLNIQWAPKSLYPSPKAYQQQKTGYLELMQALDRQGRGRQRPPSAQGLVSGVQFRLRWRRRIRRDPVLARGLRE